MSHKALLAALAATMVLLAGCTGSLYGSPSAAAGETGTVSFYISDQPNAIEDFEHLNVTVTAVGFQQAGDDEMDDNETEMDGQPENETETPENATEAPENGTEADEPEDDSDEAGGWVEFEVNDRTVDLTELRGENASLIDQFDVPEGSYNKVFVHVSSVDATLEDGESVNVKLPSRKLQINERFEVENGSEVEFVFDIAVHKAGKSGKYILQPVVSESGTDVPINEVDRDDDERDEREDDLNATFVGNVTQGENATVAVTSEGEPVENATVFVNDERAGTTDADGRLTFSVPDTDELEVTVRSGDAEAELEHEFEDDDVDEVPEGTPTATATA